MIIQVRLTSDSGDVGGHNVGLYLGTHVPAEATGSGDNNILFHPGVDALRVEGFGGFGNTSVGFSPAQGVMHTLRVTSDGRVISR